MLGAQALSANVFAKTLQSTFRLEQIVQNLRRSVLFAKRATTKKRNRDTILRRIEEISFFKILTRIEDVRESAFE